MRPVSLTLNGFASFRDTAELDFTDTDYFALVGPTGSGKSTILDAITFALYGTAPRWGSRNAVSDALAPTANRCTVSLVFDVGTERYQVAREVRRTGRTIGQKAVSLVRFGDPTALTADGDSSTVLAGEVRELTPAIESLLGLGYEDFCQCVVLPQGQFARFLAASARERQDILLKLLGANQYDGIGRRAGEIAEEARHRTELLTEQLGSLADASEEAEQLAAEQLAVAEQREAAVAQAVPAVRGAAERERAARRDADHWATQLSLLDGIVAPAGVAALQQQAAQARDELAAATAAAREASTAHTAALEAASSGPNPTALDQWRRQYAERDHLAAALPQLETATADAAATAQRTETEVSAARAANADADAAHRRAEDQLRTVTEQATVITATRARLERVTVPVGLESAVEEVQQLTAALEAVTAEFEAAVARTDAAQQAQEQAVRPDILDAARREISGILALEDSIAAATEQRETLVRDVATAAATLAEQQTAAREAERQWESARVESAAADLRPHLEVGHDCPVCSQQVAVLPPPVDAPELDRARAASERAGQLLDEARRAAAAAEQTVTEHDRTISFQEEELAASRTRLGHLVPTLDASAETAEWQATLQALDARWASTAAELTAARAHHDTVRQRGVAARHQLETARSTLSGARAALSRALGELADLDPPHPHVPADADLAVGWRELDEWARRRCTELDAAANEAATLVELAHRTLDSAATKREETAVEMQRLQRLHTVAVAEHSRAMAALDHDTARLGELTANLRHAPAEAEIAVLARKAEELAAAVVTARTASTAAEQRLETAENAAREAMHLVTAAGQALTAVRDRLAVLEPPRLDLDDLAAAWDVFSAWMTDCRHALTEHRERAERDRTAAAAECAERLAALLVETGLEPVEAEPVEATLARIDRSVTRQAEQARSERQRIAERRRAAADQRTQIEAATQRQRVADSLRLLMRSNNFPQWLASTALDSLVVGASETLRRLSNDQFDLTHEKGEFFVIDHNDADSTRSVRTLSGGETFQASLALALALSDHLAGMAGSVKLESIFLDEGFGTLDPDSLETVASTLENLAQGDRTVGVITHVPALAERAPVRFQVRRDSRTSSVTREGW